MEMGYLNGSHEHGVRGRGGPMARGRGGPPPPRYIMSNRVSSGTHEQVINMHAHRIYVHADQIVLNLESGWCFGHHFS